MFISYRDENQFDLPPREWFVASNTASHLPMLYASVFQPERLQCPGFVQVLNLASESVYREMRSPIPIKKPSGAVKNPSMVRLTWRSSLFIIFNFVCVIVNSPVRGGPVIWPCLVQYLRIDLKTRICIIQILVIYSYKIHEHKKH